MATCSDQYAKNALFNVPRDVLSYDGDDFSASKCDAKCLYTHNYAASSTCVVTNALDRLSVKYDGGGEVTYNSATYTPTFLKLFCPSITKFNGKQAVAELVIEHTAKSASKTGLLICIPIVTDGPASNASVLLQDIIQQAPIEPNTSEAISISDFNLNTIIPAAPYYTYEGPLPYDACKTGETYQYVVFHPNRQGAITLSKESVKSLEALIHFSFIVAYPGKGVFYSAVGTTRKGQVGDGIFIQCKPVGQSEEEVVVKESTGLDVSNVPSDLLQNVFSVVVGIVIIGVTFKATQALLEYIGKHKTGKFVKPS